MNRLARETSPYLLQHQHNPVDWYPWGEEAFARARTEDRPVLLSIGYSACHWCHVMERESFEHAETAAKMNALFVNVKVDREERPDVDNIYQGAVQLLRQSGGWPLTAFLTPEGHPFFLGTYFPPEPRHGLPGFPELLDQISTAWKARRGEVDRSASAIGRELARVRETGAQAEHGGARVLAEAGEFLLSKIDSTWGGFGSAPKFPSPTNLWTLWRHGGRAGRGADPRAREAVCLTLQRMADGGVYDHVGGGFHRYAVDREWHVPHFEKMLYDNAQLASLYLEAWREARGGGGVRDDAARYLEVASDTLDYLAREMRAPEGYFYSATDADSEGVEGRFFVWTVEQVRAALATEPEGEALAEAFCRFYDVTPEGNWEGTAVLRRRLQPRHVAASLGVSEAELADRLQRARRRLYEVRSGRIPPLLDDKVLVAWNGLAILAFVDGWRATGRAEWGEVARRAADAILGALVQEGRLLHSTCGGKARGPGFLDDHGAFGLALVHLWEATREPRYLDGALSIAMLACAWFTDDGGGWYQTPADGERLIVRPRDSHDSAVPSGAGLVTQLLLRLSVVTGEERWASRAEASLAAHAGLLDQNPYGAGSLLAVLDGSLHGWEEVVLAGEGVGREALERVAAEAPGLDRVVFDLAGLPVGHPAAGGRSAGEPTAWVCRGHTCSLPVGSAAALRALLLRGE